MDPDDMVAIEPPAEAGPTSYAAILVQRSEYALTVDASQVDQVMRFDHRLARVPRAPWWVPGIGMDGDRLFTVVDLAARSPAHSAVDRRLVVLNAGTFLFALVADSVEPCRVALETVGADDIGGLPAPLEECVDGVAIVAGRRVLRLDARRLERLRSPR